MFSRATYVILNRIKNLLRNLIWFEGLIGLYNKLTAYPNLFRSMLKLLLYKFRTRFVCDNSAVLERMSIMIILNTFKLINIRDRVYSVAIVN